MTEESVYVKDIKIEPLTDSDLSPHLPEEDSEPDNADENIDRLVKNNLSDNSCSDNYYEDNDLSKGNTAVNKNKLEKIKHRDKNALKSISRWKLFKTNRLSTSLIWRDGKGYHTCEICDYTSMRKRDIYCHMSNEHGEKTYVCKLCTKEFMYKRSVVNHIDYAHRDIQMPFKCEHCDYTCRYRINLEVHMYRHTHQLKPHKCEQCSYRAVKKYMLKRHKEIVHDKRPKIIDAVISSMLPLV